VENADQTASMTPGSRTVKCRMCVFPWVWLVPCSIDPVLDPVFPVMTPA
jgi:hypothetical protein